MTIKRLEKDVKKSIYNGTFQDFVVEYTGEKEKDLLRSQRENSILESKITGLWTAVNNNILQTRHFHYLTIFNGEKPSASEMVQFNRAISNDTAKYHEAFKVLSNYKKTVLDLGGDKK